MATFYKVIKDYIQIYESLSQLGVTETDSNWWTAPEMNNQNTSPTLPGNSKNLSLRGKKPNKQKTPFRLFLEDLIPKKARTPAGSRLCAQDWGSITPFRLLTLAAELSAAASTAAVSLPVGTDTDCLLSGKKFPLTNFFAENSQLSFIWGTDLIYQPSFKSKLNWCKSHWGSELYKSLALLQSCKLLHSYIPSLQKKKDQ